jgi:hypothetical protein
MAQSRKTDEPTAAEKSAETKPAATDPFADCYGGDEAPEGFVDESLPDVDGWWKAEPGLIFAGRLVGGFKITKKERTRTVALVKIARPCKAQVDKKAVRLEPGQILGVSINHALTPMLNYLEHQGAVWAKVTGTKDVGQPQPMWVYDLKLKGTKSAPPALSEPSGGSDDDIPF